MSDVPQIGFRLDNDTVFRTFPPERSMAVSQLGSCRSRVARSMAAISVRPAYSGRGRYVIGVDGAKKCSHWTA